MQETELFECKYLAEFYLHYNVQFKFIICIFFMAVASRMMFQNEVQRGKYNVMEVS